MLQPDPTSGGEHAANAPEDAGAYEYYDEEDPTAI